MTTTNGNGHPVLGNRMVAAALASLVANSLPAGFPPRGTGRFGGDPRRDVPTECGYPPVVTTQLYQHAYERWAIARKVVRFWTRECWSVMPEVYDSEKAGESTPFTEALSAVGQGLRGGLSFHEDPDANPLWPYVAEGDELSGIGTYGVLLLALDDGLRLDQPAAGMEEYNTVPAGKGDTPGGGGGSYALSVNAARTRGRKLYSIVALPESRAEILRWEANRTSPRYGHPTVYRVTLEDSGTKDVHWSRVVHLSEGDVYHTPRMQGVYNHLHNLDKVYGSDAEGFWKGAFQKLFLAPPMSAEGGWDVDVDEDSLKNMMEKMYNGSQQWAVLQGLVPQPIAPAVVDPTPHVAAQLQAIAIEMDVPMRLLMGSERGELASGDDRKSWNARVAGQQFLVRGPRFVSPVVSRLVLLGVLPPPRNNRFKVWWPDLTSQSEAEKAQTALAKTQALAAYVSNNLASVMPLVDYLTRIHGWSEADAKAVAQSAQRAAAQTPATAVVDRVFSGG